MPEIIGSVMVALDGDPALPDPPELTRQISDPDGVYGVPADLVDTMVIRGGTQLVVERVNAWGDLGARRVVVSLVGGDWRRQAELLSEAIEPGA